MDAVVVALGRGNAGNLSRWERHLPGPTLGGLTETEYAAILDARDPATKPKRRRS